LDTYLHELKDIPKVERDLQTLKGNARLQKTDIFRKKMWFAYSGDDSQWHELDLQRVNHILEQNRKGQKPSALTEQEEIELKEAETEVINEDLIALDKKFAKKKKKKKKKPATQAGQNSQAAQPQGGGKRPDQTRKPD
jgi:hypothetical protein